MLNYERNNTMFDKLIKNPVSKVYAKIMTILKNNT